MTGPPDFRHEAHIYREVTGEFLWRLQHRRWAVACVTLILPASILAVLILTVDINSARSDREADHHALVVIDVAGHEFVWHFRQAEDDVITSAADDTWQAGVLHLKPRSDVLFRVTSTDFVYIFEIPGVCREAAVPGLVQEIRFQAPERGLIHLPVDPMCAFRLTHYDSMGALIIDSEADTP